MRNLHLEAIKAVFKARYKIYIRYPGWAILNIMFPLFLTVIPLLLAFGVTGSIETTNLIFKRYANTEDFVFYVLLGSTVWSLSTMIIWDFGMWLYEEMEIGTLEQLFLAPIHTLELLFGSILYTLVISLTNTIGGVLIASLLLGYIHIILNVRFLLALAVILLGFIPLLGMSLFFGALVLKIKEPWAFFNFLTALLVYISGVFYPLAVLPPSIRAIAILFPATLQIADARAIMLDIEYVFSPEIDLLLLLAYTIIWPLFGLGMFEKIKYEARKRGSIGAY